MGDPQISDEKLMSLFLLCLIFGIFGLHRFHTGKIGTGILQAITLGGGGLWAAVDLATILMGRFTDKEGKPIKNWM